MRKKIVGLETRLLVEKHSSRGLEPAPELQLLVLVEVKLTMPTGIFWSCLSWEVTLFRFMCAAPSCPPQLAEVKVRILDAKQSLEDFIAAQEFSRAAELKDVITGLENQRNQIVKEIAESNQSADREASTEKVATSRGRGRCCISVSLGRISPWSMSGRQKGVSMYVCYFPPRTTPRHCWGVWRCVQSCLSRWASRHELVQL